jgi:hypothetical protein
MIKVEWPMASLIDDSGVCDWLEDLVGKCPGEIIFELHNGTEILFTREEDAIAFKLRFGL